MWERLLRYKALDREARKLFRRAALRLPLIAASLRLRGYKNTQKWLQNTLNRQKFSPLPASVSRIEMTCRMARAAQQNAVFRSSCLEQSLLLWYLLRSAGVEAALRIGVRKESAKFEAHAWVEHGGQALNQRDDLHLHYSAFDHELSKPPAEML